VDSEGDRDGLPNVVLEAMACGRAVVATDVGAIRSAIADGETGLLVTPGDERACASAIERLGLDGRLRTALGVAARARVEREFDVDTCTDRWCDVLSSAYLCG
jgi:glycosyltransferase involved in cell wall biosynthesis